MASRGRPPSSKTLVDRQLGRNIKHPILPAGDSFVVPNHSGDHSAGRVDSTPVDHLDLVNKEYVDSQASKGNVQLFLTKDNSDVATYFDLDHSPDTSAEQEITTTISANSTETVASHVSILNDNVVSIIELIEAGVYSCHMHPSSTGNKNTFLKCDFYKRNSGGTETLIGCTEEIEMKTSETTENMHININTDIAWIATDRFVMKTICRNANASSKDITIRAKGDTFSRVDFPAFLDPVASGLWEVSGSETQLKTADEIDMQSKKIITMLDPTLDQDAATKKYVDDNDSDTQLTDEQVEDIVGALVQASAGSGITVDYVDATPIVSIAGIDASTSVKGVSQYNSSFFSTLNGVVSIEETGVLIKQPTVNVVINDAGGDFDYIIEGDTDANLFNLDAGNDRIGISTATPLSTFDIAGSLGIQVTTITDDTTLSEIHNIVLCNNTTAKTITLPIAILGRTYYIKKINSATAGTVTIDGNGTDTIDGALTQVLYAQFDAIRIVGDGSNWHIISDEIQGHKCQITRDAAQNINNVTLTQIAYDNTDFDVGGLADLSNDQIVIVRAGKYFIWTGWALIDVIDDAEACTIDIFLNGNPLARIEQWAPKASTTMVPQTSAVADLSVGDTLDTQVFHTEGATQTTSTLLQFKPKLFCFEMRK